MLIYDLFYSPDRRLGQKIGLRLRNLLKLPKAHKWVCYEWFYSNIDKWVPENIKTKYNLGYK